MASDRVPDHALGTTDGGGGVDALPGEARVCLVATRRETFAACREGIYPAPRSYDRTRREFGYMAFYRTAPVSAVTHLAPVTGRVVETRADDRGHMTDERWAALVEPFSDESAVVVFELGPLLELPEPVRNDRNGVRGAWYCTVAALRRAETLGQLSSSAAGSGSAP